MFARRLRRRFAAGLLALGVVGLPGLLARAAPPSPSAPAAENPVVVTTRLTPEQSAIGDRMDLRVIAAYPRGYAVNLPTGFDFGRFHVIDHQGSEPESGGQGLRKTFHIWFQTFETGPQQTPAFELTLVDPQGQVTTVPVPPHEFEVASLLENEADPQRRGEDELVSREYPNERAETIIYAAAGSVLLAIFLAGAYVWWRRREVLAQAPPPVPPHLLAFEALRQLESEREAMLDRGEFPEYYVELTRILKGYVEGRFGVEALDRTTDELRRALQRPETAARLEGVEVETLIRFLQDCDLVKFARFSPEAEETRGALETVRALVQRTQPVERDEDDDEHEGDQSPATSEAERASSKEDAA